MAAEEVFVLDPLDRPVYGARDMGRVVGLTPEVRAMTAQREQLPNRRLCERFKALDIVPPAIEWAAEKWDLPLRDD